MVGAHSWVERFIFVFCQGFYECKERSQFVAQELEDISLFYSYVEGEGKG